MWTASTLEQFTASAYERRPAVLPGVALARPLFSPADACEILALLIENDALGWSANGLRVDKLEVPVALLRGGTLQDLERFIDEVAAINRVDEFTFSAHNCHALQPRLRQNLRPLLGPLFDAAGYPSNGVNLMVFGGKYRVTPAGLHNDPCDIFLAPILGGKRLYTWPWQYFDGNEGQQVPVDIPSRRLESVDWTQHLPASELLEPVAGDLLYFPAGCWHINDYEEAKRSFSFGISIFKNQTTARSVASMASRLAQSAPGRQRLPTLPMLDARGESAASIPRPVAAVFDELDEMMRLNVLQRASSAGFVTGLTASAYPVKLRAEASVMLAEGARFFCVQCADGRFAVVANGKVIKMELDAQTLRTLQRLAAGGAVPGSDPSCPELIEYLWAQGALAQRPVVSKPEVTHA